MQIKENERERIIASAKRSSFRSDFADAYVVDKAAPNSDVMDTTSSSEVNVDSNDAETVDADFDSESDDDEVNVNVAKDDDVLTTKSAAQGPIL